MMSEFDRRLAVQASCENRDLQERLELLEEEGKFQKNSQKHLEKVPLRTEKIKQRNEELKSEIKKLKSDFAEFRRTNVNELHHNYTYISTKLGSMQNENMSLRAVLNNQRQGVEKATRAFQNHQELRQLNELQNAHTKQDIQMMKKRREELITECECIKKEKPKLENELEELQQLGKNSTEMLKKLQNEIKSVEQDIKALNSEIKEIEEENAAASDEAEVSDKDLEDLREEFKELKEELQYVKKVHNFRS